HGRSPHPRPPAHPHHIPNRRRGAKRHRIPPITQSENNRVPCPRLGVGMQIHLQARAATKHTKTHENPSITFCAFRGQSIHGRHFPNAEGVTHRSPASPVLSSTKDKGRTLGQ